MNNQLLNPHLSRASHFLSCYNKNRNQHFNTLDKMWSHVYLQTGFVHFLDTVHQHWKSLRDDFTTKSSKKYEEHRIGGMLSKITPPEKSEFLY